MYNRYNGDQWAVRVYLNGEDVAQIFLCKSKEEAEKKAAEVRALRLGSAKVILLDHR